MLDTTIEKYSAEDLKKYSDEELEEILKEQEHYFSSFKNLQMSVKIFMNSIYGALANIWFGGFSLELPLSITKEGQRATKLSDKFVNHYFHNIWHKDTKLHEAMGLSNVRKISSSKDLVIYCDTDSGYVEFKTAFDSCDHNYESNDEGVRKFIQDLYEYRLQKYFKDSFQKYADKRGVPNHLDFELESIAKSGIWLAKKKYIQDIIWKDGIEYDSGGKIVPKGIEIIQSSTPKFARDKLTELSKYLFKDDPDEKTLIRMLVDLKKKFKLADVDDISFGSTANDYEKHVLEDTNNIELRKGCPIHTRGAAVYNHLVKNSKYFDKYELIKSGEKVKYYYAQDKNPDIYVFSYIQNDYPIELAPQIDYDKQFEKAIIAPLNRLAGAVGLNPIRTDLIYTNNLW